jgi:hypothetical protein
VKQWLTAVVDVLRGKPRATTDTDDRITEAWSVLAETGERRMEVIRTTNRLSDALWNAREDIGRDRINGRAGD